MRILKSAFRSPFLVQSKLKCQHTRGAFLFALLPLLVFLHGCAGAVTANSSSGAFSVTGSISPAADGNGAMIALSGPTSLTTTGNSSGTYSFSGLNNGIYTVTPSRTGYIFSPTVNSFTVEGGNVSGVNFHSGAVFRAYRAIGVECQHLHGIGLQHLPRHKQRWSLHKDEFRARDVAQLYGFIAGVFDHLLLRHDRGRRVGHRKRIFQSGHGCSSLICRSATERNTAHDAVSGWNRFCVV